MKRVLNFKVEGQILQKDGDFDNLVAGSQNYLEASFSFSDDWKGVRKIAVFCAGGKECASPIIGNACKIPSEITEHTSISMGVEGMGEDGSFVHTTVVRIAQKEGR